MVGDGILPLDVAAPEPLEGVSLFLGFSRKDARVVMAGREKVSDRLPATEEEEQLEVLSTVQQAVSYFTSNNNKVSEVSQEPELSSYVISQSDCTINLIEKNGENYVMSATLEEWNTFRKVDVATGLSFPLFSLTI